MPFWQSISRVAYLQPSFFAVAAVVASEISIFRRGVINARFFRLNPASEQSVWWSILQVHGSRTHEFTDIAPWLVQFFMDIVGQDSSPCVHKIAVKLSTLPCPAGRCKSGHWQKFDNCQHKQQISSVATCQVEIQLGSAPRNRLERWCLRRSRRLQANRPKGRSQSPPLKLKRQNDIRMKDWNRWEKREKGWILGKT